MGWGRVGCNNGHVTCVEVDATLMLCGGVCWGGVGCKNVDVTCVEVDATLMLRGSGASQRFSMF